MTSLQSIAVVRPQSRPIKTGEVALGSKWRGVCEYPGGIPAEMAVQAGIAAVRAAEVSTADAQWLVHAGVGPQGSQGWPVHHHIQNGVVGAHGNAVEMKQNCAAGLTSWLMAAGLTREPGYSICTGADNWSWCDRFIHAKGSRGEPFSDVASATVLASDGGFARLLGSSSGSDPAAADDWRVHDTFWENTSAEDFKNAYARASAVRSAETYDRSIELFIRVIREALADARVSTQYVTHFVPQVSESGEPFRSLAKALGLPWSNDLHQHSMEHGYLGVSTHADGLVHLARTGAFQAESIVLLLAAEYRLSATAIVLKINRSPAVHTDGDVSVLA